MLGFSHPEVVHYAPIQIHGNLNWYYWTTTDSDLVIVFSKFEEDIGNVHIFKNNPRHTRHEEQGTARYLWENALADSLHSRYTEMQQLMPGENNLPDIRKDPAISEAFRQHKNVSYCHANDDHMVIVGIGNPFQPESYVAFKETTYTPLAEYLRESYSDVYKTLISK